MKISLAAFVGILMFQNFQVIFAASNPYNLFIKQQAVQYIKGQTRNTPVQIYLDNDLGLQFGFDYLMDFYDINRDEENFQEVYQLVLRRNDERGGIRFIEKGFKDGIEVVTLDTKDVEQ